MQTPSSQTHGQERISSPDYITLDDEGDVILVAGSTHLRVSSDVLRIASPMFRALFQPGRFIEGQTYRDSSKPLTVQLKDDDPDVLTVLCSILHFKNVCFIPDITLLVAFTDLCDKYGCFPAALYHVVHWLSLFKNSAQTNPERLQLVWVTYAFGIESEFNTISCELIKRLNTAELETIYFHHRLPNSLRDDLRNVRATVMDRILGVIQFCVEGAAPYDLASDKRCLDCDELANSECRQCFRCGGTMYMGVLRINTIQNRKLVKWLDEEVRVWPLDEAKPRSLLNIRDSLSAANLNSPYHRSEAAYQDPVEYVKTMIEMEVAIQIEEETPGLVLGYYRVLS